LFRHVSDDILWLIILPHPHHTNKATKQKVEEKERGKGKTEVNEKKNNRYKKKK
jgi:hypothetical protein